MKLSSRLALMLIITAGASLNAMTALDTKQRNVQSQKKQEPVSTESDGDKNIRFYKATQEIKSLLDAIGAEPNISLDAARYVLVKLQNIDALAEKLWGNSFKNKPLYKQWIVDTTSVKNKAIASQNN